MVRLKDQTGHQASCMAAQSWERVVNVCLALSSLLTGPDAKLKHLTTLNFSLPHASLALRSKKSGISEKRMSKNW